MKECYIGIDIGSTNTKAVILYIDGTTDKPMKASTPLYTRHGVVFFNLVLLENIIKDFKEKIQKRCHIRGISFTSVGESVVPVKNGNALADPLFWNDPVTEKTARIAPIDDDRYNPEMNRKGKINATLSIYKIIWMQNTLHIDDAEYWLPISAYFIYRFTHIPCWDYSQATRTLLMDIKKGKWEDGLLRRFNIEGRLPAINAIGSYIGEDKEGISYALGGHDHITALFCVETLVKTQPFIFDSIGSSESMVTLTDSRELHSNSGEICIGTAFDQGRFYALNTVIYSGIFMKFLSTLGGNDDATSFFESVNSRLLDSASPPEKVFPIIVGGDPVIGLGKFSLSFINMPLDTDIPRLIHTAYIYMAVMAKLNIEVLYRYTDPNAFIVAGGGGTVNNLYLQYRAAILERPIHIIPTAELGGTGAALCAAKALKDEKTIAAFRQYQNFRLIQADYKWGGFIRRQAAELLSFYQDMNEKNLLQLLR
jgi:sugar (pentulose or hexulose) kinase